MAEAEEGSRTDPRQHSLPLEGRELPLATEVRPWQYDLVTAAITDGGTLLIVGGVLVAVNLGLEAMGAGRLWQVRLGHQVFNVGFTFTMIASVLKDILVGLRRLWWEGRRTWAEMRKEP